MDWSLILSFMKPELGILVVFIWCLGLFLKRLPAFKAEWIIPMILLVVSIIVTVLYIGLVIEGGFTPTNIVSAVIQGVIIASLAVFGNEIIKQISVKRLDDNKK